MATIDLKEVSKRLERMCREEDAAEKATQGEGKPPTSKAIDEKLLTPEGLIGDMARYIRSASTIERPQFALAAALAAGATMLGGGVWEERKGMALNLYVLTSCAAAGGKNDPLDEASNILRQVGLEHAILPPPASGAGLSDTVIAQSVGLLAIDEAGDFMSKVIGGGRTDTNFKELRKVIKELYSRGKHGSRFYQTQRARDNNNRLNAARFAVSPSISLYLTSAPNSIANALTSEEVKDGFIPRFLFFVEEGSKRIDLRKRHEPLPPELIKKLMDARTALGFKTKIGSCEYPVLMLKTSEGAMDILQQMEDGYRRPKDQLCAQGDYAAGVWGRCVENAWRVAGVVACFRTPNNPVIDEYAAQYGCDLLKYTCTNAEQFVRGKIADDPFNLQVIKVRETFRHWGKTEGEAYYKIARWVLSKNARLDIKDLDAVLEFMRETRELGQDDSATATNKAHFYWLTSCGE